MVALFIKLRVQQLADVVCSLVSKLLLLAGVLLGLRSN
jgi:hypothetical protein